MFREEDPDAKIEAKIGHTELEADSGNVVLKKVAYRVANLVELLSVDHDINFA